MSTKQMSLLLVAMVSVLFGHALFVPSFWVNSAWGLHIQSCDGDFDRDCDVDGLDLESFLWAFVNRDPGADLSGDGHIGVEDVEIFADYFGQSFDPGKEIVSEQSHAAHIEENEMELPPLACTQCHEDVCCNPDSILESACDACHSPDGAYDGVQDADIGARINWATGVYEQGGTGLKEGKEKWCMGCHDDGTSICNSVKAPNVGLFYTAGHGRKDSVQCLDCHDATLEHVDGNARTYAWDASDYGPSQSGVTYARGYRLSYVAGEVPLMIPGNYNITFGYNSLLIEKNAFRLCFRCHDSSKVLDNTPGNGIDSNFKASAPNPPRNYSYAWGSGSDVNEHVSHLLNYIGTFADSDWDTDTNGPGGSYGSDSLVTCTSCHNIHGAAGWEGTTNEPMVRDGSLAGRTGFGFSYVVEDWGSGGYPWVTSTGANQSTSVGAIFRNNTANMCAGSMCHGSPSPPPGSSYDASGSGWGTYLEHYRPWHDY
jgi:hypothetical protein